LFCHDLEISGRYIYCTNFVILIRTVISNNELDVPVRIYNKKGSSSFNDITLNETWITVLCRIFDQIYNGFSTVNNSYAFHGGGQCLLNNNYRSKRFRAFTAVHCWWICRLSK
jgi:hypothetical protein